MLTEFVAGPTTTALTTDDAVTSHQRKRASTSKHLVAIVLAVSLLGLTQLPGGDAAASGKWTRYYTSSWYPAGDWTWSFSVAFVGGVCWQHNESTAQNRFVYNNQVSTPFAHYAGVQVVRTDYTFRLAVGGGPFVICSGWTYRGSDTVYNYLGDHAYYGRSYYSDFDQWKRICEQTYGAYLYDGGPCGSGRRVAAGF